MRREGGRFLGTARSTVDIHPKKAQEARWGPA